MTHNTYNLLAAIDNRIVEKLNRKEVGFKVLDQSMDSTTRKGWLMFSILASIAEFETDLRMERQLEDIEKVRSNGVQFGRRPMLSAEQIEHMRSKRAEGALIKGLKEEYGLSKASAYRLLNTH